MRRCKGKYFITSHREDADFSIGYFHGWGIDYDDGGVLHEPYHIGSFTVAIVELTDGRIVKVLPKNLQFIDNMIDKIEQDYKRLEELKELTNGVFKSGHYITINGNPDSWRVH